MLRRSLIVGATLATLVTPGFAASGWNLILNAPGDNTSFGNAPACAVVDRAAATGEARLAGPFKSRSEGAAAMKNYPECKGPNY